MRSRVVLKIRGQWLVSIFKSTYSRVFSEDEVREQMEVNFYGPLRTVRACLPVMRAKRSGHMVLISSGAGYINSLNFLPIDLKIT